MNILPRGKSLVSILILAVILLVSGCSIVTGGSTGVTYAAGEGFAIYLTRDDVPVSQMEALSHVAIADTPVIGPDDILVYNWRLHDIALTPEAYERIYAMRPPTNGTSFVVCVDRQPVYWGAFWPMYSSQSFDGVVIPVCPPISVYNSGISIQPGYPGSMAGTSQDDPRDAPDVKAALQAAGKLKL